MNYVLYDISDYNLACLRDMPLEAALKKLNVNNGELGAYTPYYLNTYSLGNYLSVAQCIKTIKSRVVRDVERALKGYALVEMDYESNYINKIANKNDMFDVPIDFKMIRRWKHCWIKQVEAFEDKESALLFLEMLNEEVAI